MVLDNTVERFKKKVSLHRDKLTEAELKLAKTQRAKLRERVGAAGPYMLRRSLETAELRPVTPVSGKRGIKETIGEVVEGKK